MSLRAQRKHKLDYGYQRCKSRLSTATAPGVAQNQGAPLYADLWTE